MKLPASVEARVGLSLAAGGLALLAARFPLPSLFGFAPLETTAGRALIAVYLTTLMFVVTLFLVRLLLHIDRPVFGIARVVIDEAMRMKIIVAFLCLVLLILPVMPFILNEQQELRYQIQSFLSYSLMATSFLLSLMTIFLACGTLSGDMTGRQIHLAMVKPVGRGTYLLGKWLGVVLLNLVILSVVGVAVYALAGLLAARPASSETDRAAVTGQVLVARKSIRPAVPPGVSQQVASRMAELRRNDPEALAADGEVATRAQLMHNAIIAWRSVAAGQSKPFTFEGVHIAPGDENTLQLRMRIYKTTGGGRSQALVLEGRTRDGEPWSWPENGPKIVPVGRFHVMRLPASLVDETGRLSLSVRNDSNRPTDAFVFGFEDGLEIYYRADSFGPNLLRALTMIWLRLAFLAMLGLAAAVFLSFPVASVLSVLVLFVAAASPFLLEAANKLETSSGDETHWHLVIASGISKVCAGALSQYAAFSPGARIVNGRYISWYEVAICFLWLVLVWTGIAGVAGWLIFRSRELARVQV